MHFFSIGFQPLSFLTWTTELASWLASLPLVLSCSKPSTIIHLIMAFPCLKFFSGPPLSTGHSPNPLPLWLQRPSVICPHLLSILKSHHAPPWILETQSYWVAPSSRTGCFTLSWHTLECPFPPSAFYILMLSQTLSSKIIPLRSTPWCPITSQCPPQENCMPFSTCSPFLWHAFLWYLWHSNALNGIYKFLVNDEPIAYYLKTPRA